MKEHGSQQFQLKWRTNREKLKKMKLSEAFGNWLLKSTANLARIHPNRDGLATAILQANCKSISWFFSFSNQQTNQYPLLILNSPLVRKSKVAAQIWTRGSSCITASIHMRCPFTFFKIRYPYSQEVWLFLTLFPLTLLRSGSEWPKDQA